MTSVFSKEKSELFTTYRATLEFRDRILGGIPKDTKVIEAWLRAKAGVTDDDEIKHMMVRTLQDLGVDVTPDMTYDQLHEASDKIAAVKQTNGFKVNENGLYIEDRQVKAMLKEAVNILYAGERWGATKKGPRSFTAERVFIGPARINFLPNAEGKPACEPDGIEMLIIHASTPQGPRSSLSYHEYMERRSITFDVQVARDCIENKNWPEIWSLCEENGLGAARSQSYGRFDVTAWDKIK